MRVSHSRFLCAAAACIALGGLTACGNSRSPEEEELSVAANSGRYQTAYDKAREILANPSAHDEATVAYAQQVLKSSGDILTEHYTGNMKVQMVTGNLDKALGMWSDMKERVPELIDKSYDIQLRMMRVYANRNLWDQARELADKVRTGSPNQAERDEAEAFVTGYDEMKRLESEFDIVKRSISALEGSLDLDLSGGATCGAATGGNLTGEQLDLLRQFDEMRVAYDAVRGSLCRMGPPIVEPPPAEEESSSNS